MPVAPPSVRPYGRRRWETAGRPWRRVGVGMRRAGRVIAIATLCVGAAGCSSSPSWWPSFDIGFPSSKPTATTIQMESEPPGAEARTSVGPSCRTPCSLNVATTAEFSVTFALEGYLPQTVSVVPAPSGDPREAGGLRFDPNPVYAQLEPAPPPAAKGRKKPPPKKQTSAAPPPKQ